MLKRKSQKKNSKVTMATGVLPSQGHQPAKPQAPGPPDFAFDEAVLVFASLLGLKQETETKPPAGSWVSGPQMSLCLSFLSQTVCTAPCTRERTTGKPSEKAGTREQWNAAWSSSRGFLRLPPGAWEAARREGQPYTNRGRRALRNKRPLTSFLPRPRTPHGGQRLLGARTPAGSAGPAEQEALVSRHLVPEPSQRGPSRAPPRGHPVPLPWTGARPLSSRSSTT